MILDTCCSLGQEPQSGTQASDTITQEAVFWKQQAQVFTHDEKKLSRENYPDVFYA